VSSVALDRPASPSASVWAFALRLAALACVYVFLAQIALTWFNLDANVCLFWPASGVSLGVMLLGGPRYGWGVVLALAVGTGSEALLAYTLIHRMQRRPPTDASLNTLFQVTLLSGAVAAGLSTLVGTGLLLVLGWVTPAQFWVSALHWWMGDMLGIALITPMVLVWHRGWPRHLRASQWLEAVAVLALSWLAGQVIFLGWLSIELSLLSRQGYWMFFFVT
jgi:integral membrane sensor domain MASE1